MLHLGPYVIYVSSDDTFRPYWCSYVGSHASDTFITVMLCREDALRITDLLGGESTGHQWIPITKDQ